MKRAMARVERAIAMTMRMAGNKEFNGEGSKSHGNSDDSGGRATATMAMALITTRVVATMMR
jgi:hypothetical protein